MKMGVKISLSIVVTFLIVNISYAVMLYNTTLDETSKIDIISENKCIKAGVYTRNSRYELNVSSECKDVYLYKKNNEFLLNRTIYKNLKFSINSALYQMSTYTRKLFIENGIEHLMGKKNIVNNVFDYSIHYEVGKFTRKLVNINDENDVIIIKGKINRDFKANIKVLLNKYYIFYLNIYFVNYNYL